ncbi:TPA: hypothetical protein ACH3X1_003972 [Trebouxia sp. C0004]
MLPSLPLECKDYKRDDLAHAPVKLRDPQGQPRSPPAPTRLKWTAAQAGLIAGPPSQKDCCALLPWAFCLREHTANSSVPNGYQEAGLRIFHEFSKLCPATYDESKTDANFNRAVLCCNPQWGFRPLKKMLGQDNPDLLCQLSNDARWQSFFREQNMSEIEAKLRKFYMPDINNICEQCDWELHPCNEPYLQDYSKETAAGLVIWSKPGKTRGAEKLIADIVLQEGRVLIVSNRVTLAHDHISNFNRLAKATWTERHGTALECPESLLFVQYNKTMEGTDLAEVPRLVCQAESLGRLRSAEKYNLVLMDESESILMQLSSENTMGDRAGLVTTVLHDVLLKGEKVVSADAYMTNRTLNLVHQIFKARTEKVKVIYNSWCQEPHKAYRLDNKKEFVHELIKRLKSGKNCVAFCGTKNLLTR